MNTVLFLLVWGFWAMVHRRRMPRLFLAASLCLLSFLGGVLFVVNDTEPSITLAWFGGTIAFYLLIGLYSWLFVIDDEDQIGWWRKR